MRFAVNRVRTSVYSVLALDLYLMSLLNPLT